jgi:hypothetical protein
LSTVGPFHRFGRIKSGLAVPLPHLALLDGGGNARNACAGGGKVRGRS